MMMPTTPNPIPTIEAPRLLIGYTQTTPSYSLPLFILRVVTGLAFLWHGLPKILNPFHWMGNALPELVQLMPALAEFVGGIALIIGLFSPIASLFLVVTMSVALVMGHWVHGHQFVASDPHAHSYELALVYWCINLFILINGPGRYSLDYFFFRDFFKNGSYEQDYIIVD
jgi:putative oxidoreductase